jgi:hypothetical protein
MTGKMSRYELYDIQTDFKVVFPLVVRHCNRTVLGGYEISLTDGDGE